MYKKSGKNELHTCKSKVVCLDNKFKGQFNRIETNFDKIRTF